ncbi:serine hydrolase [Flavobacterium sp. HSC-61S13]|uniref:serine hydrolase domain-containing protein n=1 Tax=Flavobacterium sp. HSC-61S13 TaxID=2910963 RepID=UPI00209F1771|nr:serine hydrolase domain-containing protein [Flavobacterium sp. HSC-61S13]MCP1994487.1 D-alanyl-D-alanine carboxypeptidase [Flavobacterium sp. HSC-61S13]
MKKIFLTLALSIFGLMSAQNPDYTKSIDSLMISLEKNNAFSGSVLLQKNGKTIYKGEFNKFEDYSDKYRVGSITKIFTAIITFQLIEEGKLTLDTKLNEYYPDIKNADKITIGNLLNHTSGIYNYLEWEDYYISKKKKFTKKEMLDLVIQGKPDFKPGQDCRYSNSNYLLLGYIMEDITKKSYAENLNVRIVNKIGLQNTYCETDEKEYPQRNTSYLFDGEKWSKESQTHPSFTFSAGAVVSTTEDLSKLMDELLKGTLVCESSLSQMKQTNQKGIGYGLFLTPFYDKKGYGHSGNIDEFHSFTGYFPNEGLSISLLSNAGNIKLNEVVLGVASKYFNKAYQNPDFTTYKSKTLPQTKIYSGVYKAKLIGLINVGTFQISEAANNFLFLSMYEDGKDGQKILLERKGENKFYARKNNATFDFIIDKKGKVTGMKLTQNKQSINCKKVM